MKSSRLTLSLLSIITLFGLSFSKGFAAHHASQTPEAVLARLGIELPVPGKSIANYVGATRSGNLVYLSGHIPRKADGKVVIGKLGDDFSVDEGYQAARLSAIALLATLKNEVGDLSKVKRIVKVFGMVNATGDFTSHSQVINGCSDLLVEVFGDNGRHARAACGFSSLPLGSAVEIEMIVEVED
jgi:enamine deaminase RidA (YjgF/YER057c/UK114 family)